MIPQVPLEPARVRLPEQLELAVGLRDAALPSQFRDLCVPVLRRAQLGRELRGYFARLRRAYGEGSPSASEPFDTADRAWGLMSSAEYATILARCYTRDYLPRFTRLGIDPASAWGD